MAIRILATGGTFDKEYNERTGQLYFKDTHIAEMLRLGRSQVEVSIRTVMTACTVAQYLAAPLADRRAVRRSVTDPLPLLVL